MSIPESSTNQTPNRLAHEKSPYLLQHAYNPVDWYPWGEEAFEKARAENKAVFLSIGYSTCHWCHVMEQESFEDPEVAGLMNEAFVSIKVDREERPDIDNIYMTVCQMTTGSGGWPLTIIMTPDKKPFFAATYIPKYDRFGRIGMMELIPRIQDAWKNKNQDVAHSADQIVLALQQNTQESGGEEIDSSVLRLGFEQLHQRFDESYGGFGSAPKFPTPHQFLFLLRYWKRSGNPKALEMTERTLQQMRRGGIYDHIGFGFHRYSTDRHWLVPHFEKMLYDQALLVLAYTETCQATHKDEYKKTAQEVLTYVLRDMTDPAGGFYSAEDADSEGVEGKFYLWTPEEIESLLETEGARIVLKASNVKKEGNFIEQTIGHLTGENILHLSKSWEELSADLGMPPDEIQRRLEVSRERLFSYRKKRIHPHKDDKVLTDWNGLMIAAFAKAAQVFEEPAYAEAAKSAVDFILKNLRKPDGELLHRYRAGDAGLPAHIDDYAFLIWGLLELYEATFDPAILQTAIELNTYSLDHFWDDQNGGFFFTSDQREELLVRSKEIYDGAIPSGNSVGMLNLLRLARITGNSDWEQRAAQIARAFSRSASQAPSAYSFLMTALDFAFGPSFEVVVTGKLQAEDTQKMLRSIRSEFLPNKILLFRPAGGGVPEISRIAPFTRQQTALQNKATAYVCRNQVCNSPVTDASAMMKLLGDL